MIIADTFPTTQGACVLFPYKARSRSRALVDLHQTANLDSYSSLVWPLVCDTEYWQPAYNPTATDTLIPRQGVTVQVKGIAEKEGLILVDPAQVEYLRQRNKPVRTGHHVFSGGFIGVDFLRFHGYQAELACHPINKALKDLPAIQFVLYAHFALAEFGMVAQGIFQEQLYDKMRYNHVTMARRLRCVVGEDEKSRDYVPMPWMLTLNNRRYRVEVCFIDTLAVQGHLSYKALCRNVGIALSEKDTMHESGYIERMHQAYSDIPDIFDTYATEDLHPEEAFRRYAASLGKVYDIMGLSPYYRGEPRLTIGATTRDIVEAAIFHHADIAADDKDAQEDFLIHACKPATAKTLIESVHNTICLLGKVDGGRCRNNQPLAVLVHAILCDIDLKSCYGEGLRSQRLPFGRPVTFGYPMDQKIHDCMTLRQFLSDVRYNTLRNELVYGLWHARVSTPEGYRLTYAQDFLPSWINYSLEDMRQAVWHHDIEDADNPELGLDVKSGTSKIYTRQITDAVITSDFLDWLFYVCSPGQQAELLDHLHVRAGMLYPRSEEVHTLAALADAQASHSGHTTVRLTFGRGKSRIDISQKQCRAWYAVPLGELFVDRLLQQRALHPKHINKPLNELFKLIVNATYGDMTSPYFTVANPTVGNNVTLRARTAAWYMEKALNIFQTITDGGVLDLNRVVHAYQQASTPYAHKFVSLYRESNPKNIRHIQFAPLNDCDTIELTWKNGKTYLTLTHDNTPTTLEGEAAKQWVNNTAMTHVQRLFSHPGIRVLHDNSTMLEVDNPDAPTRCLYTPRTGLYSFEVKDFYHKAVFHGPANYALWQGERLADTKQRSYEKRKRHYTNTLVGGILTAHPLYDGSNPSQVFLPSLQHPTTVARSMVFVKQAILMPSEWRHNYESVWQYSTLRPGDGYYKAGLLRECSLSQFTFQSVEQSQGFEKFCQRYKAKYGQSFEAFFLNPNGTLNYQAMIETIDNLIALGQINPIKMLDPHNHRTRDLRMQHPAWDCLQATKAHLRQWQRMGEDASVEMRLSDDIAHAGPRDSLYSQAAAD